LDTDYPLPHVPVVYILGPGGAGKSTAGGLLAQHLGWRFVDLDHVFMAAHGNISAFLAWHGYRRYAACNVQALAAAVRDFATPSVCVLSSGFMTYAEDVDPRYPALRHAIETHPLAALLLPSFDIDECARIIVERQLQRLYLPGDRDSEEQRIRSRFPVFMALRCQRFLSHAPPEAVAAALGAFVGTQLQVPRQR
jgi:shikimate kinase